MGGTNDDPTEVVFDRDRLTSRGLLVVFFHVQRPDLDEHVVGSLYRSSTPFSRPDASQ